MTKSAGFSLADGAQDDWFILAAAVTSVATSIMTCISTEKRYQTGYHLCAYGRFYVQSSS